MRIEHSLPHTREAKVAVVVRLPRELREALKQRAATVASLMRVAARTYLEKGLDRIARLHVVTRDWLGSSTGRLEPVAAASVMALHSHNQRTQHRGVGATREPAAPQGALS